MKKNKRYLALGLLIAMVLGTTACGSKPADTPAPVESVETEATVDFSNIQDLGNMLSDAGMEGDSNAPVKKGYMPGTLSEDGYVSESLGLKYTNPEGYYMIVDDLDKMNELFVEALGMAEKNSPIAATFEGLENMKCEMISTSETVANAMAFGMFVETDWEGVDVEDESFETLLSATMQKEGYSTVDKWGRTWFCDDQTIKIRNNNSVQELYMTIVPDGMYAFVFTYPVGDFVEKDIMLSAIEQLEIAAEPEETGETEVSEEISE